MNKLGLFSDIEGIRQERIALINSVSHHFFVSASNSCVREIFKSPSFFEVGRFNLRIIHVAIYIYRHAAVDLNLLLTDTI